MALFVVLLPVTTHWAASSASVLLALTMSKIVVAVKM